MNKLHDRERISAILGYWFEALAPPQWFEADPARDRDVIARFAPDYEELANGVPVSWPDTAEAMLAAILVLDQFPRQMFRGTARAYATDGSALALADAAIGRGFDMALAPRRRCFVYMPFQHAEDAAVQTRSVALFRALGDARNLDFAIRHKQVIDRFGRFPHRNAVLGRDTTEEERAFLAQPNSAF